MFYPYEKIKEIRKNSEITAAAREALQGNWLKAVGVISALPAGINGALLLASLAYVFLIYFMLDGSERFMSPIVFATAFIFAVFTGIISLLVNIYIYGEIHWTLTLYDRRETSIGQSFRAALKLYGKLLLAGFLMALIIIGKYCLLIVPGILASLDYALTLLCLMDDPELGVREALRRSRALMHGHRWQFVCLQMRFLGWGILCLFTFGIGFLWLSVYMQTAYVAFYRNCLPAAEEEAYAKLPPVTRKSLISPVLNWIILILALLITIFGRFVDSARPAFEPETLRETAATSTSMTE